MVRAWLVGLAGLLGCSGGAECGPEECATVCGEQPPEPAPPEPGGPEPGGPAPAAVTPTEQAALDYVLTQIRAGIRPWPSEDAIGVCRGRKGVCDKFLGADAGRLSRGSFLIRADLVVPPGPPGAWKIHFRVDCTSPSGEVKTYERDHEVVHNGTEQPTRLSPLREFEVPSDDGPQTCTWKLTAPDPSGDRVFQGSWEAMK